MIDGRRSAEKPSEFPISENWISLEGRNALHRSGGDAIHVDEAVRRHPYRRFEGT
jgi:hypothetical protein